MKLILLFLIGLTVANSQSVGAGIGANVGLGDLLNSLISGVIGGITGLLSLSCGIAVLPKTLEYELNKSFGQLSVKTEPKT